MASKLYVRLKPYNPRRGYVLQRYGYRGVRFQSGHWYKVGASFAKELSEIHQRHGDPDSPFAFDVATEKQARELEAAEQRRKEEEARRVKNAEVVGARTIKDRDVRGTMTTRDLPSHEDEEDKPLGVDMSNTKAEILDAAEMLGADVTTSMSKRHLLEAIEEHVREHED